MKNLIFAFLAVILAAAQPVFAVDTQAAKPLAKDSQQALKKMQDNLRKMEDQVARLSKAKTDEDRQKLLFEHIRTMRENMALAHGMMADTVACPMMDDGMLEKKGPLGGVGMMHDDGAVGGSTDRIRQIEKRLDVMQMMVEQMMRRQEASSVK